MIYLVLACLSPSTDLAFEPGALESDAPGAGAPGGGAASQGDGEAGDGEAGDDGLYAQLTLGSAVFTVPYEVIGGEAVSGGDIVLPRRPGAPPPGAGLTYEAWLWPDGVLPYVIDASAAPLRADIEAAIAHIHAETSLVLRPATSADATWVRVQEGGVCNSIIGMNVGEQVINLTSGCGVTGTIHEFAHAFGMFHEQSRSDRDDHVVVHWANIQAGYESNFKTWEASGYTGYADDFGDYDTGSIMHYGSSFFGKTTGVCSPSDVSGCTITTTSGGYIPGFAPVLSESDVLALASMYPGLPAEVCDDVDNDGDGLVDEGPDDCAEALSCAAWVGDRDFHVYDWLGRPGERAYMTQTVSFDGTEPPASVTVRIYLSEDGVLDAGDTLLAEESYVPGSEESAADVRLSAPIPELKAGQYHVGGVISTTDCDGDDTGDNTWITPDARFRVGL